MITCVISVPFHYRIILLVCLINILLNTCSYAQQLLLILNNDGTQSSYTSSFTDEFDGVALATDKWQNLYPWGRHLIGNTPEDESLEYYTDGKNFAFNNGILSLVARKEKTCGICISWADSAELNRNGLKNFRCFDYSSGMLYAKEATGFGYYEINFRQSMNSKGMWPAFWLFGNNNEIDIFENKGELKRMTHYDLHCNDGCRKDFGGWKKTKTDFTAKFNTIGFDWTAQSEKWFCNGRNYVSVSQPYSDKMNIIVTNAVSRDKDKKGFWVGADETTVFPATLEIDYIRYYQKNYEGRKYNHKLKDEELFHLIRNSPSLLFRNLAAKRKNHQLLTIHINMTAHSMVVNNYGSRRNSTISIYDSSGKLFSQKIVSSKDQLTIKGLPDEDLVIIARTGKKILAELVGARR